MRDRRLRNPLCPQSLSLQIQTPVLAGNAPLPADLWQEVRRPPVSAALVKRLGAFPFWRGTVPLLEAVEPIYRDATARGLDVYLSESTEK